MFKIFIFEKVCKLCVSFSFQTFVLFCGGQSLNNHLILQTDNYQQQFCRDCIMYKKEKQFLFKMI